MIFLMNYNTTDIGDVHAEGLTYREWESHGFDISWNGTYKFTFYLKTILCYQISLIFHMSPWSGCGKFNINPLNVMFCKISCDYLYDITINMMNNLRNKWP